MSSAVISKSAWQTHTEDKAGPILLVAVQKVTSRAPLFDLCYLYFTDLSKGDVLSVPDYISQSVVSFELLSHRMSLNENLLVHDKSEFIHSIRDIENY